MKPDVIEKEPMNITEVRQALEKVPDEERNFRAQKTVEYVQELARLKPKQAKELFDKLMGLDVPRFREQHAHKLIDLLPQTDKQVKMILNAYHLTVKNDDVKKLAAAVAEYANT